METEQLQFRTIGYTEKKAYITVAAAVAGGVMLPQICHLIPNGGFMLLPIYFFTLVVSYAYGWKTGLAAAFLTPIVNNLLFGMPAMSVLPAILVKSVLLASAAAFMAHRMQRVSILVLAAVVLFYQTAGSLVEWAMIGDFAAAAQDFRIGIPGMLLQVVAGYFLINKLINKRWLSWTK